MCRERRRAQLLHRQWRDACELWHAACGTQGPGAAGPLLLRHARRSSGVGAWRCGHTGRRRDETYRQRRQLGTDSAKSNLILRLARACSRRTSNARVENIAAERSTGSTLSARAVGRGGCLGATGDAPEAGRSEPAARCSLVGALTPTSAFLVRHFFVCGGEVVCFNVSHALAGASAGRGNPSAQKLDFNVNDILYNYPHRRVPSRESARARRREWRSAASQADRHVARVVPPRRSREGLRGDGGEVLDERAYAAEVVRDAREALRLGPQPGGVGVVARGR